MKDSITVVILTFLLVFAFPVRGQPPNGKAWVAVESFSDEFDAKNVDSEKWYPLNPKWSGRLPSRFAKENVVLRDGKLIIKGTKVSSLDELAKEGVQYKTGILKSQRPIKYGYFEIKARVANSRISSAFWLYDHSKTTWTEIDIFELCGRPPCSETFHTNAHARVIDNITGKQKDLAFTEKFRTADLVPDGVLVAGLEWDDSFLRWYVNGKKIREMKNVYWHDPLFIVLDSEVFLDWFGRPEDQELPSEFVVDYIRVWQQEK